MSEVARTQHGPGRVLVVLYAVFAVGATSRALVELLTKFSQAPVAYVLSAFAAAVYCVATLALARGGARWWRVAVVAVVIEAVGVLTVGTFSVLVPEDFPDATVWSVYGRGYLFIPVVLPALGLWWLRRTRPQAAPAR